MKIIVVDDEEYILKVMKTRFALEGYEVTIARSVKEALEIFNDQQLDLVISDMRMPESGGMDLIREVHSIRPGFPVIFQKLAKRLKKSYLMHALKKSPQKPRPLTKFASGFSSIMSDIGKLSLTG